jgi:hypothetical protein
MQQMHCNKWCQHGPVLALQVAWLLQLCGLSVPTPKEFDDPNTTLQSLMQVNGSTYITSSNLNAWSCRGKAWQVGLYTASL